MTALNTPNPSTQFRIAYAEDHHLIRETVIDFIQNLGDIEIVIEASNGLELMKQLKEIETPPDSCLIDIVMPGMNGFETVTEILKLWPEINIIVLSGYLTEEYIVKMCMAGARGFITKNSDPREIKKALIEIRKYGFYNNGLFTPKLYNKIRKGDYEVPRLTAIELQILKYSIEDKTFGEIAKLMSSTPKSIEGHRSRLYAKLGVKTRGGLAQYAVRYGYVPIDIATPG